MINRKTLQRNILILFSSMLIVMLFAGFAFAAESEAPSFGILSLLPPIVAIGLCIITKEVIPSLFVGIWLAGTMLMGWNPITGFGKAVEALWNSLGDPWGARIVLTSLTMGGLVGVMRVGGGIDAAIQWITKKISSAKGAMFFTEIAGFIIFFEDYVNTAVVGTTMSPITDRYNISKEKLSYIVDSTAAPIACIAGISSWIAYMVGQIGTQFADLGIEYSPYMAYLKSIPFVLYNIVALVLLTYVVMSQRDMGPMLKAERRARKTGQLLREGATPLANNTQETTLPEENCPLRGINFVLPILFLVGLIFAMLVVTGGWPEVSMAEAIGMGSSSKALVWGSFGAVFLTIALYKIQGLAKIDKLFKGYMEGMMSIFVGTIILVFAWGIGSAIKEVGTASYLVNIAGDVLAPSWIPVITFITGALVSFCTGTSYGTMAILMPIVVPLVFKVSVAAGIDPMIFMIPTIGAVFGGAVWGDHCSPISDTTIMSSMFTGSDHIDHVNSQIPYALTAAFGALAGYVGVAFQLPAVANILIASVVACLVFRFFSKPLEA